MLSTISKKGGLGPRTSVDILTDDVLLEIFNHHRLDAELYDFLFGPWKWHRLAHVCRRWRTVIFNSPRHLKLRLIYTHNKPAQKNLDCWPDLPLSIRYPASPQYHLTQTDEENIIAALGHPDRICEINLYLTPPLFEKLAPLMLGPFPMLETLDLDSLYDIVFPSTFLGGFAPQLRRVCLTFPPFLTLPQFLLTAPALVSFQFFLFPGMGYLSLDALVTGLDAKPTLEVLHVDLTHSHPGQQSPHSTYPQTRVAFPALTEFRFKGGKEYLEDLICRIDTPKVEQFFVTLSYHRTLDFPRLAEFISRTEHLTSSPHRTSMRLWEHSFTITHYFTLPFPSRIFELQIDRDKSIGHINCDKSMGHIKSLIYASRQLSLLFSNVERLDIEALEMLSEWYEKPDTVRWLEWLELFSLFSAVRILELIGDLIPFAASALEQSSNMGLGTVLPFLQVLHMRCLKPSAPQMESFLAFRRHSGRVVSIHYMREEDEGHDL